MTASLDTLPPVTDVPTAKIHVDPDNSRKVYELDSLLASIRRDGILQAVGLWFDAERDAFFTIWGNRRVLCAKKAGKEAVPARVFPGPLAPGEARRLQLVENLQRTDLLPSERAVAFRDMMKQEGLTVAQLAESLQLSTATICKTSSLLKLAPPLLAAVDAGRIGESVGYELSHLEEPAQLALVEGLGTSYTREDVQRAVKARKANGAEANTSNRHVWKRGSLTLTFRGETPGLDPFITELTAALGAARKAKAEGITDLATFLERLRVEATT